MFKRSDKKPEQPKEITKIQPIDYNEDEYSKSELMSEEPMIVQPPLVQEEVKIEAPKTYQDKPQQNFTGSAFSIIKDGNSWLVIEIPIDPVTKTTGNWIIHAEDGTRMGAQQRFKIIVAQKIM